MLKRPKFVADHRLTEIGHLFEATCRKHNGNWPEAYEEWAKLAAEKGYMPQPGGPVSLRNAFGNLAQALHLDPIRDNGDIRRVKRRTIRHPVKKVHSFNRSEAGHRAYATRLKNAANRNSTPSTSTDQSIIERTIERTAQIMAANLLSAMGVKS